jgi:PAS domain S-box-containing protein
MTDSMHILVVDDQEESCILAANALRHYLPGCRISMADDGPGGLAAALETSPDLVVLDAGLPGLHGFEVCRQLKERMHPVFVPVLIVTGVSVESCSRAIGIECGADGYLTKPYDVREFMALVKSLLRLKRNDDALRAAQQMLAESLDTRTQELRQLEQSSRQIIESLVEGLAIVVGNRVVFLNPAFAAILGRTAASLMQLRGRALAALIDPVDRGSVEDAWRAVLEGGSVPRQVFRVVRHDGVTRWLDMSIKSTVYAGQPGVEVCALDVTDRRLADLAVQRFSRQLLTEREHERHRLSAVLHHECGSFALAMNAHLAAAADGARNGQPEMAIAETARTRELLDDFVGRIKRLAIDLRPPDLDVLGFSAVLANHVSTVRERTRIDIRLIHAVPDAEISQDLATLLFRVAQEALNNAVRHAGAAWIEIRLHMVNDRVELTVTDIGCGFDPAVPTKPDSGIGLRAMAEMVAARGGTFGIETRPGSGTVVRACLPRVRGPGADRCCGA